MKSTIKNVLRAAVPYLPWGAKTALLDSIVEDFGTFATLQRVAEKLGIESIGVRGANGLIWGSVADSWILGNYAMRHTWEYETVNLFETLFQKNNGGTFFDIGANIGLTLFPLARIPNVECFAFEPDPRNLAYLKIGILENCPTATIHLLDFALFDRTDTMELELSTFNFGDHRIRTSETPGSHGEESRNTISIRTKRLDDVEDADKLKRPLGVKMDIQGAEPFVVAGGQRTLAVADLLVFEYGPYTLRRMGGDVTGQLQFIARNYREGVVVPAGGHGQGAVSDRSMTNWRPISAVVSELEGYWRDPQIGPREYDVGVRK